MEVPNLELPELVQTYRYFISNCGLCRYHGFRRVDANVVDVAALTGGTTGVRSDGSLERDGREPILEVAPAHVRRRISGTGPEDGCQDRFDGRRSNRELHIPAGPVSHRNSYQ